MSDRSNLISKLQSDFKTRAAYINAKVSTLVPSQIRGLRLKSETPRQPDLAEAADMYQSRISMLETAGANPTLATLSEIAAALKVGLKVEFVPFSEMLTWENNFRQDEFGVVTLDQDRAFLTGSATLIANTSHTPNPEGIVVDVTFTLTTSSYSGLADGTTITNAKCSPLPDGNIRDLSQSFNTFLGPKIDLANTDSEPLRFFRNNTTLIPNPLIGRLNA